MRRFFFYTICLVMTAACNDKDIMDSPNLERLETTYYLPEVSTLLQEANSKTPLSAKFEYLIKEADARGINYQIERDDSIRIISFATTKENISTKYIDIILFHHSHNDIEPPYTTIYLDVNYDYDTKRQMITKINHFSQTLFMGNNAGLIKWETGNENATKANDTFIECGGYGHIIFKYYIPGAPTDANTTVDKIYSRKETINVKPQI